MYPLAPIEFEFQHLTSSLTQEHLLTAQQVIQYLPTMCHYHLIYGRNNSTELTCYSDSNWGGNTDNGHSTSGHTFILRGRRSNHMVSAEAMDHCLIIYWSGIHGPYRMFQTHIMDTICTLTAPFWHWSPYQHGVCMIALNNIFHKCMKHINIKYHFVQEKVTDGIICLNEVDLKNNLADVHTKALPWDQISLSLSNPPITGEYCKQGG